MPTVTLMSLVPFARTLCVLLILTFWQVTTVCPPVVSAVQLPDGVICDRKYRLPDLTRDMFGALPRTIWPSSNPVAFKMGTMRPRTNESLYGVTSIMIALPAPICPAVSAR